MSAAGGSIGSRLHVWRCAAGVNAETAAAMLGWDGDFLARIEAGEIEPEQEEVERVGRLIDAPRPVSGATARMAATLAAPFTTKDCAKASPGAQPAGDALPAVLGGRRCETVAAPSYPPCAQGPCPDCMLVIGGRVARVDAVLAKQDGHGWGVQLHLGGAIYDMGADAARQLMIDLHPLLAVHDNPEIFEGKYA